MGKMSVNISIIGYKPPDNNWKRMKAVYDACVMADVKIPQDVVKFFNGNPPSDLGVSVYMTSEKREYCKDVSGGNGYGYEIDVEKMPKDIKIIKVLLC
jgi:hypothetical protein